MESEALQPGQKVQFKLGDVHLPAIQEVLNRMSYETELQGTITLLSDHGEDKSGFVVLEVKGILMPIIVPAACLKLVGLVEKLAETKSW